MTSIGGVEDRSRDQPAISPSKNVSNADGVGGPDVATVPTSTKAAIDTSSASGTPSRAARTNMTTAAAPTDPATAAGRNDQSANTPRNPIAATADIAVTIASGIASG